MNSKLLNGRKPCTHCGECCKEEVCPIGEIFTGTTKPPCPALAKDREGKYWCGLIVCPETAMHTETKYGRYWARIISKFLEDHVFNFGDGCERTAEKEAQNIMSIKCEGE